MISDHQLNDWLLLADQELRGGGTSTNRRMADALLTLISDYRKATSAPGYFKTEVDRLSKDLSQLEPKIDGVIEDVVKKAEADPTVPREQKDSLYQKLLDMFEAKRTQRAAPKPPNISDVPTDALEGVAKRFERSMQIVRDLFVVRGIQGGTYLHNIGDAKGKRLSVESCQLLVEFGSKAVKDALEKEFNSLWETSSESLDPVPRNWTPLTTP